MCSDHLIRAVEILLLGLSISGCHANRASLDRNQLMLEPSRFRLPLPTMDEVALVNGEALTLMDYHTIRAAMTTPSSEGAYWIGTAALSLYAEAKAQGNPLSQQATLDVARYAAGELPQIYVSKALATAFPGRQTLPSSGEVRKTLEYLIAKSEIRRTSMPLSQLGP